MKYNLKKVATVFASALMLGSTAGLALAANYPAPFVSNGAANVAVVVGSASGADDGAAALDIAEDLSSALAGSTGSGAVVVEGGDSFRLEKSSTKFNLGDSLNTVYSSLDSDELEEFLADGSYDDGSIDTDFTQKITLGSEQLTLFADTDYNNKAPTVGFHFSSGAEVLNYTVDFDDAVNYTLMEETYMPLFGKDYYVTSTTSASKKIVLLDSSKETIVAEGETVNVDGYEVSIDYIASDTDGGVKFNVNGESTDKITEGESYKLNDGSYISLTDNMYASKDSGVSKAQFSIGSGKITLEDGKEVTIGSDNTRVKGLYTHITESGSKVDTITLQWKVDKEAFLTESSPLTMPQFDAITLSFGGLEYSGDPEAIELENGETLTLKMGNYDIPVMWYDGSNYAQGEEDALLKIATINTKFVTNSTSGYPSNNTVVANNTDVLALKEDQTFVVTYIPSNGDLGDVETLYYKVDSITADADGTSDDPVVELVNEIDGKVLKLKSWTSGNNDADVGDVTVMLAGLGTTTSANDTIFLNFTRGGSSTGINYNKVVSDKGLVITLPEADGTNMIVDFREADDDDNINGGAIFQANVSSRDDDTIYAKFIAGNTTAKKEVEDRSYVAYTNGTYGLSTMISTNEPSSGAYDYSIKYYGQEVPADVVVSGGANVIESDDPTSLGIMTITDTEAAASTKNLIVIGGSCVNSLAADLLGVSAGSCGSASGLVSGQAMIKSFARTGGKVAVLIAGYEKSDTAKAATFAINNDWDSSSVDLKLSTATADRKSVV